MKFIPSILLLIFGAAFLGLWMLELKRRFTMILAASFCLLSLAMLIQTVFALSDARYSTLLSGSFYTAGVLLAAEGVLERSGRHLSPWTAILYLVGIVGGLWYFSYLDQNLIVRIYILNFGMGLILLHACGRVRFLAAGTRTDRVLFWLLAALGLHFVPRTLLTLDSISPVMAPVDFARTAFWQAILLTTPIIGAVGGLCLLGILVVDIIAKLRQERDIDALTGVLNRRGLERYTKDSADNGRAGAVQFVALCDLDRFKTINDTYGHAAGDTVLATVADIIRQNVRKNDVVARFGGEEFMLILSDMNEEQAFSFSERVREALAKTSFPGISAFEAVTCSVGLARLDIGEPFWSSVNRADTALYAAKRGGRNRTCAEWMLDIVQAPALQDRAV